MKVLSIIICKIAYKLLKIVNRGSNLPGAIALKIDRNIIKKLKLPKKIIVVTGSSGKGSTSGIIAHTMIDNGYKVCHNKEGANQIPGVITALLRESTLTGKVKKDAVILEMDERTVKYIFKDLKPTDVVITNITRDQPPRQRHTDFIIDEIKKGLTKDIHLYLNANDPILRKFNLDEENEVTYYSVNKLDTSYSENIFTALNSARCPKCHHKLDYKYYHFEDLGDYKCSKCKFKMPKSKYVVTDFNDEKNIITINKKYEISVNNDMLYNIYNTLAAYSVLNEFGIKEEDICKSIDKLNKNTKVFSKKSLDDRKVYVLNNKCENATTYNQSMLYTLRNENKKTIVLGWQEISRRYIWDELSWLYDVEFEVFNKQDIDTVIVAGPQKYDLAVRLKYAGIDTSKIKIKENLYEAKEDIKDSKGDIYAILNFDYLDDFSKVMEELGWK